MNDEIHSSPSPITAGKWDARLYDDKHAYVYRYGMELLDLLQPQPHERFLDLGCGTGHLTHELAQRSAEVIGIDASEEMIQQARARYPALAFRLDDARTFVLDRPVDGVISNAVLHWILEAESVVRQVSQCLKPGGRFVFEFGGKGNVAHIEAAIRRVLDRAGFRENARLPVYYFPSIAEYASLLEAHKLEVIYTALFERPTPLEDGGKGLRNWMCLFARAFFETIPPDHREALFTEIETELRPFLYYDECWHADYRRLRMKALKHR